MKFVVVLLTLCFASYGVAQEAKTPATLKSILLQQLRETHNEKNWFVSEKEAVAGLTGKQAEWTDGKNHSVGQLVQHLNFWNASNLARVKGEHPANPADNNDTFKFEVKDWDAAQKRFDEVMNEWENVVQSADDAKLAKMAPLVARIAQHNAYHIAEMVTSRKAQGVWNPENGVK
jgi:uncharacterized damage-inducible protein DinB